jgi:YD repeat-containing protein
LGDDSGLDLLAEFDYTVGRTGKRSGVAEEIDGVTSAWQYEYDGLGRICDATRETSGSAVVYDYQYDLVGNRTEKSVGATTTTYEYNALDQLETETVGGIEINYDYDANGNLKQKSSDGQETHYLYDARNKLKQVFNGAILDGNLAVEFAYDFSGNRYAKSTRAGQDFEHTRFLIDNNNLSGYSQTLLEYEYYTGAVEKRYEYGDDLYCEDSPSLFKEGAGGS